MADIRRFQKEKEKRENYQENYKTKIHRHRLSYLYRVLLVLIAIGALFALVVIQYKRHVYTGYDIVSSLEREAATGATEIRLGDSILTYSKDGAHCTNQKGEVLWNQTYEIQDVLVSICQDVVAIGSYNGRNIYIMNSSKQLGSFSTTMPIRSIAVDAGGNVAVVMADTNITYIHIYDSAGKIKYNGETTMKGSGYPTSVSLSPGGELMIVSYTYLDAGIQKTSVAFYNLGAVGKNYSDLIVGGYDYTDVFVPYVQFMNDDTAFAVGDDLLMIYKGQQRPEKHPEFIVKEKIRSVFFSEKYIGLVFYSDNPESQYRVDVYNSGTQLVGSYYFSLDYTDIFFEQDSFVIYNETECLIMTLDGNEKYRGDFHKTVRLMMPTSSAYKYQIVTNESIDTIQLK